MDEKKKEPKTRFDGGEGRSLHIWERWEIDAQNIRILCSDGKYRPLEEYTRLRKEGYDL